MYYLVTEYELPILMSDEGRRLITMGNKEGFMDMYDYYPLDLEQKTHIVSMDGLKEFMQNGFATKKEAENATELKEAIKNFIGFFFNFNVDFVVMLEKELFKKYETLK